MKEIENHKCISEEFEFMTFYLFIFSMIRYK